MTDGPHADQPMRTAGEDLSDATAGVVALHGRGASAASILGLAREFDTSGVAYLAPQAANRTWYPNSFMAPIDSNQPYLDSALGTVADTMATLEEAAIPRERVLLFGFSQGACLASEFVARNPQRYGGLAALSGGVIGPAGTEFSYEGDLDDTPVFIGCSNVDPHIPVERVRETTRVMEDLHGDVTERIYEGMGHTINEDEIAAVDEMLSALVE